MLALCLCACSMDMEVTPPDVAPNKKIEVSIGQTLNIKSRTTIGDDGHSAEWSKEDKIAIWAEGSQGNFALNAETFFLYRYVSGLNNVIFTAFIDPMPSDSYTYYAAYPIPNSVNGTKATYTIPAVQQGDNFVGSADIMVATPVTAPELAEGVVSNLDLRFTHKMHALRITLPGDGKLMDTPVDCVEITFPTDVVGDVTVDAANPLATPVLTNGSKSITINVPKGYSEGDYIWAVIFPTTISGDISYRLYAGEFVSKVRTVSMDKVAEQSHITPMNIAIPDPYLTTTITLDVKGNNLGEDYNSVTIIDNNGKTVKSFAANGSNRHDLLLEGVIDASTISGQKYTIRYESNNAIVEDVITMPKISPYRQNNIASTVPYLLFEDFSSINTTYANKGDDDTSESDDREQPGESLNKYMDSQGWSAARFMVSQGNCVRINVRYQMVKIFLSFTTTHRGRLDTPQLSGLKSGSTVKLKVTFDAGAHVAAGSSMDYTGKSCTSISVSTHTNAASAINGVATGTGENGKLSDFGTTHFTEFLPDSYAIDSWTSSFPTKSISVPGVTEAHRLCFYVDTSATLNGIGNEEFFVYIDNIKVSIDN